MPLYQIQGVSRDTGTPITLEIQADDTNHAHQISADQGVMVRTCNKRRNKPPIGPRPTAKPVPEYLYLNAIGTVFVVLGAIILFVGMVGAIVGAATPIKPQVISTEYSAYETDGGVNWAVIGPSILCFFYGLFTLAIGQATIAFRDIARNSWRSANAAES